jgi:hypothetical protein
MVETVMRQMLSGRGIARTHDRTGREITVRLLTALDRLRLFKAIGATLAENPPYLGMAILAFSVAEIDGVPVPSPATESQLEALVQRLGDEGVDAIAEAVDMIAAPSLTEADAGN